MALQISGLESLIKKVEGLPQNVEDHKKEVLEKLAQIGVNTSTVIFKTAQYDGTNDVVVDIEWVNDNTILVVARGQAVTFIEFGSGVTYSEPHPLAVEVGAIRGNYGKGRGKDPTWSYYGEEGTNGRIVRKTDKGNVILTKGNPPAKAMYEAGKKIREKVLEIVREVYLK